MPPPPPTIQRLLQHPERGLPWDVPYIHTENTPETVPHIEAPPDPPNNRRNLDGANPQSRRRSQDLITGTPSSKNNHVARATSISQTSGKGRSGPAPPNLNDIEPHYTSLNPLRTLSPSPAPQQWGSDDESPDIPDSPQSSLTHSPMQSEHEAQTQHEMTNSRGTYHQHHQLMPKTNQIRTDPNREEKDDRQRRKRARYLMDKHKIQKEEPQPHRDNNVHERNHYSQLRSQPPNTRTSRLLRYNHILQHKQTPHSHQPPYRKFTGNSNRPTAPTHTPYKLAVDVRKSKKQLEEET